MAIAYATLKTELTTDPISLGLVGMDAHAAAAKLNEVPTSARVGLQKERVVIPTWEIFEATLPAEWSALSAAEKQRYQTILSMGTVNVKKSNTRSTFAAMFGVATTTRANLIALQYEPASRAEVLFGEPVWYWDIERARAL